MSEIQPEARRIPGTDQVAVRVGRWWRVYTAEEAKRYGLDKLPTPDTGGGEHG